MTALPLEHRFLHANGLRFHVVLAGPHDGPLLVLLHGFPEFWFGWRHQIGPLAAAGWRVAVPDQRGYGESDKPAGRDAYGLDTLADDVQAIATALERPGPFAVAGHDWGGIVAWHLAGRNPERIARAAVLNAPHPGVFLRYALRHPAQLARSWYIGFFQLPLLPEAVLRADGFKTLCKALTGDSPAGTFSDDDVTKYRAAWAREGALTAMLNWYRAMPLPRPATLRVGVPFLLAWGDRDTAFDRALAEESIARCDNGRVVHLPDATHWLHHEQPARVNRLLLDFFAAAG